MKVELRSRENDVVIVEGGTTILYAMAAIDTALQIMCGTTLVDDCEIDWHELFNALVKPGDTYQRVSMDGDDNFTLTVL